MSTSSALIATAVVLGIPTVIGWIVAGMWYADETVADRAARPRWLWPGVFAALAVMAVAVLALLLAAIWGGMR